MKYVSTRGTRSVSLDEALAAGIADDGGLFMPESLPAFQPADFADCDDIGAVARRLLRPFFASSSLLQDLDGIVDETFAFPIPVRELPTADGRAGLLELFHGPTAAFKDVGAAFLAACLTRLQPPGAEPLTILVATSGDTGGAVAAAFDGRPNIRVAVLFPDGRVSARQQQQLTCWGDNVLSLAVQGAFDDCQALVKAAFSDSSLAGEFRFSSANSINIGRLLPQSIYYADASLRHWRQHGRKPSFIIPTGNLGNALAAILARDMGLPIGEIVLAVNENRLIADYLDGCDWTPRSSVQTLASAMDVGNPSNMERLRALHGDAPALRHLLRARAVTDAEIREQIRADFDTWGIISCPHTATASRTYADLSAAERREADWILVATAHAAKFESIVEPLIGEPVPLPAELARILERPSSVTRIEATGTALAEALRAGFRVDGIPSGRDK